MIRSQLVALLNELPDIEVGTDDGSVAAVHMSTYDTADENNVPYINLEVTED